MKRLFVALDLPDSVTNLLAEMNPHLPGVRWVRADQVHLTLSFFGNVTPLVEERLRDKLAAVRFPRFFLPIIGAGTFPAKGKPNVIWAGVGDGDPQLFHLHKRVVEAALASGLEPDLRAWHPHVTLARCRDVAPQTIRRFVKDHADLGAGLIPVESFSLYSSVPGPLGSVYNRELEIRAS